MQHAAPLVKIGSCCCCCSLQLQVLASPSPCPYQIPCRTARANRPACCTLQLQVLACLRDPCVRLGLALRPSYRAVLLKRLSAAAEAAGVGLADELAEAHVAALLAPPPPPQVRCGCGRGAVPPTHPPPHTHHHSRLTCMRRAGRAGAPSHPLRPRAGGRVGGGDGPIHGGGGRAGVLQRSPCQGCLSGAVFGGQAGGGAQRHGPRCNPPPGACFAACASHAPLPPPGFLLS